MRVANIIEEGKLGGPQVRMVMVAATLDGRVDTMVIMPAENSETFRRRCDAFGVAYKVFPITRITKEWRVALRYVLFSFVEIILLASFLRRGEFDLVHVSGGSWQYKGAIAGKLAGKKVLWHLNDTSMPSAFRVMFGLFSPLADGFIFASERSRVYYGSLIAKHVPCYVVPAPVDTSFFDPGHHYAGDEQLIDEFAGRLVVGTTANINSVKGLDTFIHAAAAVNEREENVVFVVIGVVYDNQKRYFARLKRLCHNLSVSNIKFVGGRTDVRPLLNRFDIYVCSSNAESSPIAVWEAMAMAKPIVSTNVGDVPLYVSDGDNGFICDVGDSATLAERLGSLIADAELRREFGGRGRDTAVRELDIKHCAERHLAAYAGIFACK